MGCIRSYPMTIYDCRTKYANDEFIGEIYLNVWLWASAGSRDFEGTLLCLFETFTKTRNLTVKFVLYDFKSE